MKPLLLTILIGSAVAAEEPLSGIFSGEDYPSEALKRGEEGKVTVRLRISKEGVPVGCMIVESASQSLDAATCYAYMRRARFKPVKDQAGNPKEDDYVASVVWVPPKPDAHGNRR